MVCEWWCETSFWYKKDECLTISLYNVYLITRLAWLDNKKEADKIDYKRPLIVPFFFIYFSSLLFHLIPSLKFSPDI